MASKSDLLLLFDRPYEPIFVPRGNPKTVFQLPNSFLVDRYRKQQDKLTVWSGKIATRTIQVKDIAIPPLDLPMLLERREHFSFFHPKHRRMAEHLLKIFMDMKNVDDLLSIAVYCHDRINTYMFHCCLSIALLHREDTKDLKMPNLIQIFPNKFVDTLTLRKLRMEVSLFSSDDRIAIPLPVKRTASRREQEQRVAYFREDVGINSFYWHWYLVHPLINGGAKIADKDRRGELFYYVHHQIMARFNVERFCNDLERTVELDDYLAPIEEAYFPKLDSTDASRVWASRFAKTILSDLQRPDYGVVKDIFDLQQWRKRLMDAAKSGTYLDMNGTTQKLTEDDGIETLANMVEPASLSVNPGYYGSFNNDGHLFVALAHDPDDRHLEMIGVMGDHATMMRDPVFYRWHAHVNKIFGVYKNTLPSYTKEQLDYPNIVVNSVRVDSEGGIPTNQFKTFWQTSDVNLAKGLDFARDEPVCVSFTHLQHQKFTYNIDVSNNSGRTLMGTVRIFMAPKLDEHGKPMSFDEQKNFMIELDKFVVPIKSGTSNIQRRSDQSSVTIPFEKTFGDPKPEKKDICECGWPDHMLIPKGTLNGLQCELFVMISNYEDDKVDQEKSGLCDEADSYCGIFNAKYPDRRAMGYPFDRKPRTGVDTLAEFLTPNMKVTECLIKSTPNLLH